MSGPRFRSGQMVRIKGIADRLGGADLNGKQFSLRLKPVITSIGFCWPLPKDLSKVAPSGRRNIGISEEFLEPVVYDGNNASSWDAQDCFWRPEKKWLDAVQAARRFSQGST